MYKYICMLLLVVYHLYQPAQCSPCPLNAIEINICGTPSTTPTTSGFHLLYIGDLCIVLNGEKCQYNTLIRTENTNRSVYIYLYQLPYQTEQLIKNRNSRFLFLNQIDISEKSTSSTKCLETLNYETLSTECNNVETTYKSSIDISGLTTTIHYLGWQSLVFIYDKFSEGRVSRLQLQLSQSGIKSSLIKFDDLHCENIITKLHEVYITRKDHTNCNIVLICSLECTTTVLIAANNFDDVYGRQTAFHHHSNWLIASPLINRCTLHDIPLRMDNVAIFMEVCFAITEEISVEYVCGMAYEFAVMCFADETCHGKLEEEKQILLSDFVYKHLKRVVDHRKLSISTLTWGPKRRRELRHIGYISKDSLVDMEDDIFPNRQYGLNNKTLLVSTNLWEPFVMKKIVNSTVEYYGFCIDMLKQLAEKWNFSYIFNETDDKQWGVFQDGQWTGVIGDLITGNADLVVAPISISPDREEVMDFTTPFFYEKSGIGLKMPDPNSTKWKRLLKPLSWQVLLCVVISFVSFSVIFTSMEVNNPYYQAVGNQKGDVYTIPNKISYLWGALLLHGGQPITQSSSGRILVGCWWIFCIVMAATYSGNLIAFLTVDKDAPPISSLNDMLNTDGYKWGLIGSSVYLSLFRNSKREDYQKIWNGIVEFNKTDPRVLSLNSEDHLDLVMEGSYAFLGEYTPMELWQRNHCDIFIVNENFYPVLLSFGLRNNSDYTMLFTEDILKMHERGLLRVLKDKWWPKFNSTGCKRSPLVSQVKAVDLLSLQSMFYVIAIGLFLSFTTLTIETIINTRRKVLHLKPLP